MTVSTSVRRAGTVSAATVALVLSGGGLALAASLPSDGLSTTLSSTTGALPSATPLPVPVPTLSQPPLPLPLPTTAPTSSPKPGPTPTQTLAPVPGGSGGGGSSGGSSGGSGGSAVAPIGTGSGPRAGTAPRHATTRATNETYTGSANYGDPASWAMPSDNLLAPNLALPGSTALRPPATGSQPLVAGNAPQVVQLAGATAQSPAVASGASRQGERQVAGLVIVFAVVTIGGVAAGHASLLQQRFARAA